ncbi:hypothetical protein H257_07369 [Aphanomyces astaci]|uniref:Uncharacterized protein n=1 Tax=Aphanomyces astaci TaxID=112090 RepID=W4GI32_APHAT|nr:hypothetical protein H257_07369 [Aphanomyces astaci]ETV79332.1 hypothetical protein H257_07369 [Aphanomyces astaci]|eukprot:XP_009831173.1 hypothetical protein H257_07369 [Aphanomyces astaci]
MACRRPLEVGILYDVAGKPALMLGGHYFGGEVSIIYLNDTHVLDLETLGWDETFIFGGKGAKGALYRDMFYLDIETWHWCSVNWTTESPSERPGRRKQTGDFCGYSTVHFRLLTEPQ